MADTSPNFPMSSAKTSSLACRGVVSSSYSCPAKTLIFPIHEESPTAMTIILPSPVRTLVPLNRIGQGTSCF